ncbi:DUF6588 family protein [Mucilaginibacter sp. L3T2-6]|uniref:DUF6588 family protein n=1 Tax=Mucilaginibacter sp. L3T2-6 TaxID=3062491 RepID=UPI0026758135|nr:DUF6588 family protein [Mucilaginibacter sp. L3T2-6]MDO3641583.1 hypothetical protein [Mucilaginibacter sp. L3T2-6]MDV6214077.1 DUF6588 family protein [Mucilaginibacter sp. L3T2-6]
MKKSYLFTFFIALLLAALRAGAQDSFSGLIKSSPEDATKLLNAYAMPMFRGLGIDQNSGWTNTAKTKGLLKFDLRITASATFISSADKTFDVTKIGLSNHVRPANPNEIIAPTFGGKKNDGPLMNIYDDNGQKVGEFNTPAGVLSVIPAPQVQVTVGIIQNTDVTLRAIPKVSAGSDVGSISMIGFGIKHDIMQDIAGKRADALIPFDLSIALGYSHLNLNKSLQVDPDEGAQPKDSHQSTDFSNQHIEGNFNSFMGEVIISKKLLAFTPFLAVGYNTTHAAVAAIGNYPVTTGGTLFNSTYTTFTNPVSISENVVSGVRADLGFQLTLGFFRFYASGSIAQYKSVNAGIGFGI